MTDPDPTLTTPVHSIGADSAPLLGLTILWHPDQQRVGQQFMGPAAEGAIALHRRAPLFRHPGGDGLPLEHRCIARQPLAIVRLAGGALTIAPPASRMTVEVNGQRIDAPISLPATAVERGIVLGLGGQVLLCLHWIACVPRANALPGLQGVSSAIVRVREQIVQVARTSLPVLLLGETGTGKDAAARAIHAASERAAQPFVAVNMAALNETLAAADLFGALKGAYTGAQTARAGFFAEAGNGTLFLDEIGDAPAAVQPMLLRVLESGEYRPLGAQRTERSQARLVTATDQDLGARGFNRALLRRIEAFVIRMPALRERREDIGVLLVHHLHEWSAQSGKAAELPFSLVSEICNDDWPGNVRQLAHVLRRAALAIGAGAPSVELASLMRVEPVLSPRTPAPALPLQRQRQHRVALASVSAQQLLDALENHGWRIKGAAGQLGISRPSFYKLLGAHPAIRPAELISTDEIRATLERHAGDLRLCASSLKTPYEALRRHARALGLLA